MVSELKYDEVRTDTLRLTVVPDTSIPLADQKDSEWYASVEIRGSLVDLRDLGLFMSSENINIHHDFATDQENLRATLQWDELPPGNEDNRHEIHFLQGAAGGPEWAGIIIVSAKTLGALSRCDVDQWDHTNILKAAGYRWAGGETTGQEIVYNYQRRGGGGGDENTNCIYGMQRALEGLWPWPREEHVRLERSRNEDGSGGGKDWAL